MPNITISINEETKKTLKKRADKNLLTLKDQIEDILRKSAVRTRSGKKFHTVKVDDKLVAIFSRDQRGRPKKKKVKKK